MKSQILPLSVIAQQLKINKSRLQYYRNLGLIQPKKEFSHSHIAFYDLGEVITVCRLIKNMRKRGYNLSDIKDKLQQKTF